MRREPKTLFISDLHLAESEPFITACFLSYLAECDPQEVDALYILGDLFESWIGDDNDTSFNRTIINAIKAVTDKGIPIYFMRGNRDFLIGNKFARKTGCVLLPDEKVINLYGEPVLLVHGDTLCTRDKKYLAWRKKARNPILHTLFFLILPLSLRRRIANQLRMKSKAHTQNAPMDIMDVTQDEVMTIMQKYKVKTLIHGHTHRPAFHQFKLNSETVTRIVLAAWHTHGSALECNAAGVKTLKEIT
ncbi:MAG: UDP-2,3-diacylglucosamine diphosphatase [Gammaproteobacteria bacterium RIFCSPHIGHO2_12_FULL_43_28]|nr:MAG: UDP-2,3-diacylglucosamine diphosphatase [Gammaproteobacteria bacterium RIFCSPHIGHO2_12_FULL_43_28]